MPRQFGASGLKPNSEQMPQALFCEGRPPLFGLRNSVSSGGAGDSPYCWQKASTFSSDRSMEVKVKMSGSRRTFGCFGKAAEDTPVLDVSGRPTALNDSMALLMLEKKNNDSSY